MAGEKVLEVWTSEQNDRKVLILRPNLVFGINNTANMYKLINQINMDIYFYVGKADNIKSTAYVENVVNATLWVIGQLRPSVTALIMRMNLILRVEK